MLNEELGPGMEVSVEYDGQWQKAKVIGPVTLTTGTVTEITGWKLHVGPSALDLTMNASEIYSNDWKALFEKWKAIVFPGQGSELEFRNIRPETGTVHYMDKRPGASRAAMITLHQMATDIRVAEEALRSR